MYVDSQARSIPVPVVVAGVLGAAFTMKRWWYRLRQSMGAVMARLVQR